MGVKARVTVTLILIALGIFQAVSGIILFLAPKGPRSGRFEVFGVTKYTWNEYHKYVGLIIIVVAVLHFILNWRMFVNELKVFTRSKKS